MPWKQRFNEIFSPREGEAKVSALTFLSKRIEQKARDKSTDEEPMRDDLSRSNIQRVLTPSRQLGESR
jgi:hypothetical protein